MTPEPDATRPQHQGSGKLAGKVAMITGGDSGIGRAVAVLFAREGADVAIGHLAEEDTDANETLKLVEAEGRRFRSRPVSASGPFRAGGSSVREPGCCSPGAVAAYRCSPPATPTRRPSLASTPARCCARTRRG
jgi:NAD(P)-dependent dehydrogenase (short-subunit alcohol dehydrogenase family)